MARASWAAANAAAVPGPQDESHGKKVSCLPCMPMFVVMAPGSTETKVESFRSRFSSCILWDSITLCGHEIWCFLMNSSQHISPPCGIQMQCLHIHPHYLSLSRLILKKLQALNMKKPSLLLGCIIESSNKPAWHRYFCPRSWIPPASASGVEKRTSIPWHKKKTANVETSPGWNENTTHVISAFFNIDIVL